MGKVLLSPDNQRSKRAINMIREFARHHMKTEDVRIDEDLAHQVWERGIKHPPRKIRVRMTKTEEGHVLIAPYEEEIETKVSKEEEPSKLEEKQVEEVIPEKPKEDIAAEIVEEAEKEIPAKPKKTPTKEQKPKAPAKEEKPKLASFVDPSKGAQHYIDRYNKETKYKEWFHRNFPNMTIEEAVGLEPSKEKPKVQTKEQKPKAPAKEDKPKKTAQEKPKTSAKEDKPKKAPAKESTKEQKPKKKSS